MKWLSIFVGGGLGAVLRVGLGSWVVERAPAGFPWGTFAVNALGCLGIGVVASLAHARGVLGTGWQLFLTAGLLGGFTTFSAFGYEAWTLFATGARATALLYAFGSVAVGLLAVATGIALGRVGT